jgi:hypothetical protein
MGVDIDISEVCAKLLMDYDKDRSGLLSAEELASVPPLNSLLKKVDSDNDGSLSREELEAHFLKVFNPKSGLIAASCRITNKGKPIGGATVHFIPADYLQLDRKTMPIASGITSPQGIAQMEIHPDYLPPNAPKVRGLVRPGLYLVDVTRDGLDIPPEYNSETTCGVEVSAETTIGGPINIPLEF